MIVVVMIIVVIVVVIAVVFAVPVAFMNLPALLVVVVMGVAPIGAGVWWPLPHAGDPDVAAVASSPVAVGPDEAFSRHRRPYFIPNCGRGRTDINLDLAECGNCESRCGDDAV